MAAMRGKFVGVLVAGAALLFAVPVQPGNLWWVGSGFVVLLVVAVGLRAVPAIRVGVVAAVVIGVFYSGLAPAVGTLLVCVVLLAAYPLFARLPFVAPTRSWLVVGRFTPAVWALLAVMIVGAAGALVGWVIVVDPPPPPFFAAFSGAPSWLLVLGFSLVNAVWEEAFFRGIVQSELTAVWGVAPAVVLQAVAFGIAHLHGFPSGWTGVVMSGVWGLFLGVLRVVGGGMAAPYVAHVGADLTIAVLAVALLS